MLSAFSTKRERGKLVTWNTCTNYEVLDYGSSLRLYRSQRFCSAAITSTALPESILEIIQNGRKPPAPCDLRSGHGHGLVIEVTLLWNTFLMELRAMPTVIHHCRSCLSFLYHLATFISSTCFYSHGFQVFILISPVIQQLLKILLPLPPTAHTSLPLLYFWYFFHILLSPCCFQFFNVQLATHTRGPPSIVKAGQNSKGGKGKEWGVCTPTPYLSLLPMNASSETHY